LHSRRGKLRCGRGGIKGRHTFRRRRRGPDRGHAGFCRHHAGCTGHGQRRAVGAHAVSGDGIAPFTALAVAVTAAPTAAATFAFTAFGAGFGCAIDSRAAFTNFGHRRVVAWAAFGGRQFLAIWAHGVGAGFITTPFATVTTTTPAAAAAVAAIGIGARCRHCTFWPGGLAVHKGLHRCGGAGFFGARWAVIARAAAVVAAFTSTFTASFTPVVGTAFAAWRTFFALGHRRGHSRIGAGFSARPAGFAPVTAVSAAITVTTATTRAAVTTIAAASTAFLNQPKKPPPATAGAAAGAGLATGAATTGAAGGAAGAGSGAGGAGWSGSTPLMTGSAWAWRGRQTCGGA
jgi:hypothetical protein